MSTYSIFDLITMPSSGYELWSVNIVGHVEGREASEKRPRSLRQKAARKHLIRMSCWTCGIGIEVIRKQSCTVQLTKWACLKILIPVYKFSAPTMFKSFYTSQSINIKKLTACFEQHLGQNSILVERFSLFLTLTLIIFRLLYLHIFLLRWVTGEKSFQESSKTFSLLFAILTFCTTLRW